MRIMPKMTYSNAKTNAVKLWWPTWFLPGPAQGIFTLGYIVITLTFFSTSVFARLEKTVPTQVAKKKELPKFIDAVQRQYNSTNAATFNFEQSYKHPFLNVTETSKGVVKYSRAGGKMLWNYVEPKNRQKKFYINGNRFTYYSITDKIAYTHDCYDQETLSASVAFLLGTGNLRQSFTITFLEADIPNPSLTWLSLSPKENNAPVKRLLLGIDNKAKVVESLVEDPSGGKNHFKFIDFKMVKSLPDNIFVFTLPKGVKLEPMPNVVCPKQHVSTAPKSPKTTPNKILPAGKK